MTAELLQVIQGVLLSLGALLVFVAIFYFGNIIFDQEKLHRSLRLQRNYKFLEFTIFKFSLFALLAFWCVQILLRFWDAPKVMRESFDFAILQGATIYGVRIIPMRLIIALLVYSSVQMAWKYALLYFSKSEL